MTKVRFAVRCGSPAIGACVLAVGSILVFMANGVVVGLCWTFLLPGRWRSPSY